MKRKRQTSLAENSKPKKKHYGWIIALVFVLILALAMVVGYHTFHIWEDATCLNPAICRICEKSSGQRLEHIWAEASCSQPKTCTLCGKQEGDVLEHNWVAASCSQPKTCSLCSKQEGETLDHTWQAATCQKPQTCAVCNTQTGSNGDHDWQDANCQNPQTCSVCNKQTGETGECVWLDATYNAPKTCAICSKTEGSKKKPSGTLLLSSIVSRSTATSQYKGDQLGNHGPEKLYDRNEKTNWTEGATGTGVGESVTIYFDGTYALKGFQILSGSHFDKKVFKQNNRPKMLRLTFSDGSSVDIALEDKFAKQFFTFKQYYYTDSVTITILDIYSGTMYYYDTVIAEVDFTIYQP